MVRILIFAALVVLVLRAGRAWLAHRRDRASEGGGTPRPPDPRGLPGAPRPARLEDPPTLDREKPERERDVTYPPPVAVSSRRQEPGRRLPGASSRV